MTKQAITIRKAYDKLNQMKTSLLQQLSKEITQGKWATDIDVAIEIIDREGAEAIDFATVYQGEGSGKGSEVCALRHQPDDGLDLHDARYKANAQAISLTPQLIREVLELRKALCDVDYYLTSSGQGWINASNAGREAWKQVRAIVSKF